MSDILQVECRSCGARMSGIRTEFGSLVVPGQEECRRCGATEWVEATDEEATSGTATEADDAEVPAETGPRISPERTVESRTDPETAETDSETRK